MNALLCVRSAVRHKHHKAIQNSTYNCIRKESKKGKGTSARGKPAPKQTKSVQKRWKTDLDNQLEKAHLESQ